MCPGGEVIQCASEPGGVVVNGMSNAAAGFRLRQFGPGGQGQHRPISDPSTCWAGMYFQRKWEQAAFRAAGGDLRRARPPSVQDFLQGRATRPAARHQLPPLRRARRHQPPACPASSREQLLGAIPDFDRKLHGFTSRQALLLAIESRTSSPVQLLRGDAGESRSATPGSTPAAKAPASPAASLRRRWTASGWRSGSPARPARRRSCLSSAT